MYEACFDRKIKVKIKRQALDRNGEVHELEEVKETIIPADIRAQKYWLDNRAPDRWSERPETQEEGSTVVAFIPVPERMEPEGEAVAVDE